MRFLLGVICSCLLAAPAYARQVAGVGMPERVEIGGEQLRLNGMGLRKEVFFKVYVAGLYLEKPTADAGTALSTDQPKRIVLHMLRNVDRGKLDHALTKAFEQNAGAKMPSLRGRLDQLRAALPAVRTGDVLEFSYVPGVGTVVHGEGRHVTIPGKDFNDALFAVWLGAKPVDDHLKRSLLTP